MDREQLGDLWEQATELPDAKESPLTIAIITEALEAAGDGVTCDPEAAAEAVERIAWDCHAFANTIAVAGGKPA